MKKKLFLKVHLFFVFIASIVSFSGAIMHATQVNSVDSNVQEETKEAADGNRAQPIPEAPPFENAEDPVAQQKRDKKAQLQQERGERARVAQGEEEETKEAEDKGEAVDLSSRTLLIFNDSGEIGREDENSAFTRKAIAALSQKAGPILITGSLLTHIFNIQGNHHQDTKNLLNVFYALFDATQWQVYKLKTMYLLIPRIGRTQPQDFNLSSAIHIDTISKGKNALVQESDSKYQKYKDAYLADRNTRRIAEQDVLADIVTLLTGMADKVERNWVIYLGGHGSYKQSIAGFDIPIFKQLIDFLDTKIKTKLFVYSSCYAAGFNAGQVYGDLKYSIDSGAESQGRVDPVRAGFRSIQDIRTYPFTIVTGATTDAPTYGGFVRPKNETIDAEIKYDTFVKETQKESINYPVALGYLFPLINRPAISNQAIASIPQIRPAHVPAWFALVDYNKAVIRIGKVMAYTKEKNKDSLVIKQYKDAQGNNHDPKAILIATDNVPFAINIDENIQHIPPVISLIPGEATHTLQLITPADRSLYDFIEKTGSVKYGVQKTFDISTNDRALCIFTKNGAFTLFQGSLEKFKKEKEELKKQNEELKIKQEQKALLFKGAEEGNAAMVQKALDAGIDANAIRTIPLRYNSDIGLTALHIAADQGSRENDGHAEIIRILVQKGADINSKDSGENTPLHKAAYMSNISAIKELIKQKAMINIQNNVGNTPLHNAVERLIDERYSEDNYYFNQAKNVIQLLIDAGADTTIKNNYQETALDMLREAGIDAAGIIGERNGAAKAE